MFLYETQMYKEIHVLQYAFIVINSSFFKVM